MMQITGNDIRVLKAVARYYVLTRAQIHRICFPNHKDGRATRKRLSRLVHHRYLGKLRTPVAFPGGNAGPAYFPTAKGNEMLSAWFDDERYLAVNTRIPRKDLIFHWLAISDVHLIVEQAVVRQDVVSLDRWINEWETIDKSAAEVDRFHLHTQLQEHPPLSCSPDAGFLLSVAGFKKVFYVEADRGTSGIRHVAAFKTPGYAELARRGLHRRHFPETNVDRFTVLCITTDARRRNALAKAVGSRTQNDPSLWLFIDQSEMTLATFLHGDITYNCACEPGPLINKTAIPDPSTDNPNKR